MNFTNVSFPKIFDLNFRDLGKGFIVTIISTALTVLYSSIAENDLPDLAQKLTVLLVLISLCTIAVIVVFFFYFTRPTKTDILVFKQIQMERMLLRDERKVIEDLRDSLKKDRLELYKLQQKK